MQQFELKFEELEQMDEMISDQTLRNIVDVVAVASAAVACVKAGITIGTVLT